MKVNTFGVKDTQFNMIMTIGSHAEEYRGDHPKAVEALASDLYSDTVDVASAPASTGQSRQLGSAANWAPGLTGLRRQLGSGSNWAPKPTGPRNFEPCFPARDEANLAL